MSEAERPQPAEPPATEERPPDVAIEGAGTRCPYCHESVRVEDDAWTVCGACLARHHEACWDEHGCCSSCEGTVPLTLGPAAPGRLPPVPEQAAQTLDVRAAIREARALYKGKSSPLILAGLVSTLLNSASSGIIGGLTGAGLWSMHLSALRGQGGGPNSRVADLFAHAGKFVPLLLAMFAMFFLTLLATPLLLVGALFVSGGLGYTLPLIAERGLGVKQALKTSWRLARSGGLTKHALLALLTALPAVVLAVPVLGIVAYAALTPLVFGTWAAAYRQVTGEGSGPALQTKGKAQPKGDVVDEDEPEA